MTKDNKNNKYIKTLDGWRAVAIIAVILSHLKDVTLPISGILSKTLALGLNGVDLFFAISGYIISVKLFSELEETGTINFKKFYIRRTFRLLPASLSFLGFLVLLKLAHFIELRPIEIGATLFFWRNYLDIPGAHYTAQFWSLSVEEHFYLFFPSFIVLLKSQKKIFFGILILGVWVAIWRKIGTIDSLTDVFPLAKYDIHNTVGRLDGLLFGALLAFIQKFFKNFTQSLAKIPPYLPVTLILLLFLFPFPLRPLWKSLLFPLLIFSTMAHEESYLSKFLELKFMTFIGRISYSLYIWHTLFVYKSELAPSWFQYFTGGWIAILPTFVISYLSFKFIETPMRQYGVKLSNKRARNNLAFYNHTHKRSKL